MKSKLLTKVASIGTLLACVAPLILGCKQEARERVKSLQEQAIICLMEGNIDSYLDYFSMNERQKNKMRTNIENEIGKHGKIIDYTIPKVKYVSENNNKCFVEYRLTYEDHFVEDFREEWVKEQNGKWTLMRYNRITKKYRKL